MTSRIRIGTTVAVLPLRHPLLLARSVATIDRLIDAGWCSVSESGARATSTPPSVSTSHAVGR
ncbi:LLM class flavin-dependent oxidoreductase [Mycobacteroides chelonae]|uniref:LLM class flavin-dependent oxidoreductase n=1 Tax=Mycobacteroides chelonae TaxID=1774 RepID=UPI0018EEF5B4|nr:LLM class flavin-dependent oxidoreductase [Mycobacteroides chelonae]QQG86608.1 LLM class flavin-dependent oxidoreductase [Mycobacteroides chelonae]QQG91425.1 LLM class flavin-dependent oxidoreductase [Mycobacteroides chelonae]